MSVTTHLIERKGVWYYRRRVPTELVPVFKRAVIQHSLKVTSKAEAKKLRAIEDAKWDALFEQAGASPSAAIATLSSGDIDDGRLRLSGAGAIEMLREYVERQDRRSQHRLASGGPSSEGERRDMIEDVESGIQILKNLDDPRGDERIYRTAGRVLADAHAELIPSEIAPDAFEGYVRRALVELDQRRRASIAGDHAQLLFDPLFDPARPPPLSFGELCELYLRHKGEEGEANGTAQKSLDKTSASVALLREIVGAGTTVSSLDYEACMKVRSTLARVPSNWTKKFKGVPLADAIARGGTEGAATLAFLTQQHYLGVFRELVDLAWKKRLVPANFAHDLKPLKKESLSAADRRIPFTLEQLNAIFGSEYYLACARRDGPAWKNADKPWRFWLPLICLLMGTRPREVCQLHTDDIRRTEAGTWYLDLIAEEDDEEVKSPLKKVLKTTSSKRRVPIHPTLIAMGFLEFVREQTLHVQDPRLFADLKPNRYGDTAQYALKRFNETFLPEAIDKQPRQSFYSFRHCFRDELRRINAPPDALQALGGWSQGKLASDNYGEKSNPDYQRQFIEKIAYPGLDLSHFLHIPSSY